MPSKSLVDDFNVKHFVWCESCKNVRLLEKCNSEAPPLTPPLNLTSLTWKEILLNRTNKIVQILKYYKCVCSTVTSSQGFSIPVDGQWPVAVSFPCLKGDCCYKCSQYEAFLKKNICFENTAEMKTVLTTTVIILKSTEGKHERRMQCDPTSFLEDPQH